MKTPVLAQEHLKAYAATSKDFNPIHTNPAFAKDSPFGGVIVHGMLSMGVLGQFAEGLFDDFLVAELSVRFQKVVQLGTVLTCAANVIEQTDTAICADVTATNEQGEVVTAGRIVLKKY